MNAVPPNELIWISAGEVSGDMHGASLFRALRARRPSLLFTGMGGPAMRAAGFEARFRMEDLAVMGLTEVLAKLPGILRLLFNIRKALIETRPRAIVVIDAPDFHFRVIRMAHSLGIPVYYYISPKLWAWRQGRARFLRDRVRKILSILPFEREFYQRFGMDVDYVGNPTLDEVLAQLPETVAPEPGLIGLMPGSRASEVRSLMPEYGKAARLLLRRLPHLSFLCLRAPNMDEAALRALWPDDVPLAFRNPEDRLRMMSRCEMIIAASGTATLECALAGTPTLVCYKLSPLSFAVGRRLIRVPFISLPNLILGREIFPELLQEACDGEPLAEKALALLLPHQPARARDSSAGAFPSPLEAMRRGLREVRERLGEPGAPNRAAEIILRDLGMA